MPRKYQRRQGWRLAAIAVAAIASSGRAARADDCAYEADNPRTLCGHQFVPSSLAEWGFITSTIATTSTLGIARFDLDRGDIAARELTREGKMIALAQTFSGGVALSPWFGISGRLTGSGLIPKDVASALFIGAHENLGVEGTASLALVRTHTFLLTAAGSFGYSANRDLVPSDFPNDDVLQTGHITTVRPALIAALAVTPVVGLQASGSYTWNWIDVNGSNHIQKVQGALALSFALDPVTFLLGGAISQDFGDDSRSTALELLSTGGFQGWVEGGVFYTGRRDLDLGAVVSAELGGNNEDRRVFANVRLGYYF